MSYVRRIALVLALILASFVLPSAAAGCTSVNDVAVCDFDWNGDGVPDYALVYVAGQANAFVSPSASANGASVFAGGAGPASALSQNAGAQCINWSGGSGCDFVILYASGVVVTDVTGFGYASAQVGTIPAEHLTFACAFTNFGVSQCQTAPLP